MLSLCHPILTLGNPLPEKLRWAGGPPGSKMAYEEVNLDDMKWDLELEAFTYECPCGDLFQITMDELEDGEEIANCPSCSLIVLVEYGDEELQRAKVRSLTGEGGPHDSIPPTGAKAIAT